jgi:hypothetical protein
MRSRFSLSLVILFTALSISCSKKTDEILAMLQEIKQQNSDLKAQVTNLQKTTDSLSNALKLANQNITSMDKKIDSIRIQLASMVTQVNSLSAQLNQANVNIADLQKRIAELQTKCQELVDLLRLLTGTLGLSDGLVAYYPFSGNAGDSSGNGNHGIVYGPLLTTDRFGNANNAFYFDGINDYIEVLDDSTLDFTNKYSISVWINIPDYSSSLGEPLAGGFADKSRAILNKPRTTGWADGYALKIEMNDTLVYSVAGNLTCCNNVYVNSNSKPQINTWVNYTTTYDGSLLKLFVNGKLVNSKSVQFVHPNSSTSLFLGKSFHTVDLNWYEWFKGQIDDVRLYNRELSESEITYLATH